MAALLMHIDEPSMSSFVASICEGEKSALRSPLRLFLFFPLLFARTWTTLPAPARWNCSSKSATARVRSGQAEPQAGKSFSLAVRYEFTLIPEIPSAFRHTSSYRAWRRTSLTLAKNPVRHRDHVKSCAILCSCVFEYMRNNMATYSLTKYTCVRRYIMRTQMCFL